MKARQNWTHGNLTRLFDSLEKVSFLKTTNNFQTSILGIDTNSHTEESLNHQNPSFLWKLFTRKEINYNLRIKDMLTLPKASAASIGTNSASFRGSILWNIKPDVIKSSNTTLTFRKNMTNWSGEGCNSNICLENF